MLLHDSVTHRPDSPSADLDRDAQARSQVNQTVPVSVLEEMVAEPTTGAEDRLWPRVVAGLGIGFVVVAALAFALLALTRPELPLIGQLGFAAFIGFWSSPFVGFSAAVGYHQVTEAAH